NAQGEDVVAGVRTPHPIADLAKEMPAAHKELMKVRAILEKHFKDMQDLEFTVEENRLYILQTRNGKRTGHAAVRIAVDMVDEKLIAKRDAVRRVPADSLAHLLAPIFDRQSVRAAKKIGSGLAAGPGAACGRVVFNAEEAVARAERGEKVVLARIETSPEDLRGMIAAEGILTARGGVSSHAALVARQMGKVCVCGATGIQIDYQKRTLSANGTTLNRGDYISIDGTAGEVFAGEVATAPSEIVQVLVDRSLDPKKSVTYQEYAKLMKWADEFRTLGVRANADTPEQVTNAVAFGAEGIGLTRTEHMFFEGDRIDAMREMILAGTKDERARALAKLLPYQRGDFIGIFTALKGLPATIRFLDPPLHEFLPHDDAQQSELAKKLGVPVEQIKRRVQELHEFNPMLGHRGCRLGITFPEISEMQARAIFEAAAEVQAKGIKVHPEIMIPLVGFPRELKLQIDIVRRVAGEVAKERGTKFKYLVGTMIEIPRAALVADQIARDAEFFSFGTNDLTQTTLGMSRDDSGSFLPAYAELDIVDANPFASIDQKGVGRLMEITRDLGRKTRPEIKLGICGEHGGEPSSVKFCHRLGLNYVSTFSGRASSARELKRFSRSVVCRMHARERKIDSCQSGSDFARRHIGPNEDEVRAMLREVDFESLDTLIDATIPKNIRLDRELNLPKAKSETEALAELLAISKKNRIARSFVGAGYYDCITPPVIQRNILENPGWYTAYTPYQAEIAQGRLEALLNFQQMIMDLTALDIANASLLDEATAAAEAMTLCHAVVPNRKTFFVADNCHPQTIAVVQTRAKPLGIEIKIGDYSRFKFDNTIFGALVQYPATDGAIYDYADFGKRAHDAGALVVVAADILALTLLKPPGEFGADVAVGNTQRFGVPLGFGGPHAAYFATRDQYKRHMPGRLVGVSHDAEGRPAYRLALQTREQHIRRDKATSNICTAQVLLAVIASMYAVYHGPKGLRAIAERVHRLT
ncbi:MAG: pyruvate, phosphate dikinase, partial [Verrucomicrobia bacterium]